jgi:hypothetical protein
MSHGSIRAVLNAAKMVKDKNAPESLVRNFKRQLADEKVLVEQFLELDPELIQSVDSELRIHFKNLEKNIDKWFRDRDDDNGTVDFDDEDGEDSV